MRRCRCYERLQLLELWRTCARFRQEMALRELAAYSVRELETVAVETEVTA